jgi:hypothetical protein
MGNAMATRSVSRAVVEQVAAAEGIDPVDITVPLFEVIDPDALDSLFSSDGQPLPGDGKVTFGYHGYRVTVSSDGSVSITAGDATGDE